MRTYHTEVADEIPSSKVAPVSDWRCNKCGKAFKQHKNLRKHIDIVHGRETDTISEEDDEDMGIQFYSNTDPEYCPKSAKRKAPDPHDPEKFDSGKFPQNYSSGI